MSPATGADLPPAATYYTVAEAAAVIGVWPGAVYKWLRTGRVQGRQIEKGLPWAIPLTQEQILALRAYVARVRRSKKEAV